MIPIQFQNEHFVVVHKPSGMLSVPSRLGLKDPRPVVGWILQEQLKQQVFPVHRLDFEVSGLLLFALTEKAHRIANSWFENKKINKVYQATTSAEKKLSNFNFPESANLNLNIGHTWEWNSKLLRGKKRVFESPHGAFAMTRATLLEIHSDSLIWKLEPVTGKSHQLRYELAKRGFPILGDALYGGIPLSKPDDIELTAVELVLPEEANELGLPLKIQLKG